MPEKSKVGGSCAWLQEKPYVLDQLRRLESKQDQFDKVQDELLKQIATQATQGKAVEKLEQSMNLSREDIASLKVKASLIGVGAAMVVELVFLVGKNLVGK